MNIESSQPKNNNELLPLSIWLRGDEPYFEEFSLDADEVMSQLGIKRSRLRQISGQELRVGRKRVERYIKPFYRPKDVEDYLGWTRATASHQKSSLILNSAADNLVNHGQRISESILSLKNHLIEVIQEIPSRMKEGFQASRQLQMEIFNSVQINGKQLGSIVKKNQSEIFEKLTPHFRKINDNISKTSLQLEKFEKINHAFLESISLIQSNYSELAQLREKSIQQYEMLEKMQEQISTLCHEVKINNCLVKNKLKRPKIQNNSKKSSPLQTKNDKPSFKGYRKINTSKRKIL